MATLSMPQDLPPSGSVSEYTPTVSSPGENSKDVVSRVFALVDNAGAYQDVVRALDASDGFVRTAVDRQQFIQDTKYLRRRIRATRNGLINPRSAYVGYWDLLTGLALIYTATVTPFEVCLGMPTSLNALFVVNQVINLIFVIDIVVQFFLPVPDKNGEFIRNRQVLAKRYLKTWFSVDVISILPIDIVALASPGISSGPELRSIRLLRVFRLLKLARVLRASRIIQRWQNAIEMSSSQLSLMTILVTYAIFVHWFACLWALLPQLYTSWRADASLQVALADLCPRNGTAANDEVCLTDCELSTVADLTGHDIEYIKSTEPWVCRGVRKGLLPADYAERPFLVWIVSMETAVLQFAGSVGSVGPTNAGEVVTYLVSLTAGRDEPSDVSERRAQRI